MSHLFKIKVKKKMSDSFFEIYRRLLPTHPRLIKSNHAETFHSKLFSSVSRWPENLKVSLFSNVKIWKFYYSPMWDRFLLVRCCAATWDYSDITICNHLLALQRPRNNSCQSPASKATPRTHLFFLACRPVEKIVYFCLSQIWYLWPGLQQPSSHNSCD